MSKDVLHLLQMGTLVRSLVGTMEDVAASFHAETKGGMLASIPNPEVKCTSQSGNEKGMLIK